MKKYLVTIIYSTEDELEIEADSEQEAIEKAEQECLDNGASAILSTDDECLNDEDDD